MKTIVRIAASVALSAAIALPAMAIHPKNSCLKRNSVRFLKSDTAAMVASQVMAYQRVTGGWPKNIDMCRPHTQEELDKVMADKSRTDDSTTDNNATVLQMKFLAKMYQATGRQEYRDAFVRAVEYLLSGQYPEGGWPQFWPDPRGYQVHVTYNDHAMVNTMSILRDISAGAGPYTDMIDKETALRIDKAFAKGIEWILADQIRDKEGRLTVWCQQHDRHTHAPAMARSYELPSYCSSESVGIIRLLMSLPEPDARVRRAVHSAMAWLDAHKIEGFSYKSVIIDGQSERVLVPDPTAEPLWARFYDLENAEPFVSDRDGVPVRDVMQIGRERRNGYGWYNRSVAEVYPAYLEWAARYPAE